MGICAYFTFPTLEFIRDQFLLQRKALQILTTSKNVSFQSRPLMTADEIMRMKKNEVLILMESAMPVKAKKSW